MLLPINNPAIRNSPLGPEKPGPEPIRRPTSVRQGMSPGLRMAQPATFRHGGRVKRTGMAKVHKGETVVTAAQSAMGAGKKSAKVAKKQAKAAVKIAKKKNG